MSRKIFGALLAEFIGTLFLTFITICVACNQNGGGAYGGPIATGMTVAFIILSLGPNRYVDILIHRII